MTATRRTRVADPFGEPTPGGRRLASETRADVLGVIARRPDARLRDIARTLGMTEGYIARVVRDLERDGAITRQRHGRRNHYVVVTDAHLERSSSR